MKNMWSYGDFYDCIPEGIKDKIENGTLVSNEYDIMSKSAGCRIGDDDKFARFYYMEQIIDFEEDTISHPTLIGHSDRFFIEPKLIRPEEYTKINGGIQNYVGPLIVFNTTIHGYYFIRNDGDFYNYTNEVWNFVNQMGIDYTNMSNEDYNLIKIFLLGRS